MAVINIPFDVPLVRSKEGSRRARRSVSTPIAKPEVVQPDTAPEESSALAQRISRDILSNLFIPDEKDGSLVELRVHFQEPQLSHVTCPVITSMDTLRLFEDSVREKLQLKGHCVYIMSADEKIIMYPPEDTIMINQSERLARPSEPIAILSGTIVYPQPSVLPEMRADDFVAESLDQAIDSADENPPTRTALAEYATHLHTTPSKEYNSKVLSNWMKEHEAVGCVAFFANGAQLLISGNDIAPSIEAVVGKSTSASAVHVKTGEMETGDFLLVGRFPNKFLRVTPKPIIEQSIVLVPLSAEQYQDRYRELYQKYDTDEGLFRLLHETIESTYENAKKEVTPNAGVFSQQRLAYEHVLAFISDLENDDIVDIRDFFVKFLGIQKDAYNWSSLETKLLVLRQKMLTTAKEQAVELFIKDIQTEYAAAIQDAWIGGLQDEEIAELISVVPETSEPVIKGSTELDNLYTRLYGRFVKTFDVLPVETASSELKKLQKQLGEREAIRRYEYLNSLRDQAESLAGCIHSASVGQSSISFYMRVCIDLEANAAAAIKRLTLEDIARLRELLVPHYTVPSMYISNGILVPLPSKISLPSNAFERVFVENNDPQEIHERLSTMIDTAYGAQITDEAVATAFPNRADRQKIIHAEKYLRDNKEIVQRSESYSMSEAKRREIAQKKHAYLERQDMFIEAVRKVDKIQRQLNELKYKDSSSHAYALQTRVFQILRPEFISNNPNAVLETCIKIATARLERVKNIQDGANEALLSLKKMATLTGEIVDIPKADKSEPAVDTTQKDTTTAQLTLILGKYAQI